MVLFQSERCWEAKLKRMLDDQKPEDAHLDYKAQKSLLPPGRGGRGLDSQKRAEDISKDVSSFLNSDGGVLVYGVPESEDASLTGGSPIPGGRETGFRRGEVAKETVEDLITSNIQPRPGPGLFQVTEVPFCDRIVIVVEVAVGLGNVWQAKDKKYYKRFNYKAEPMDHYEIDMVRNRSTKPNLKLTFGLNDRWETSLSNTEYLARQGDGIQVHIGVQNTGSSLTEVALIELGWYPASNMEAFEKIWQREIPQGILPTQFRAVGIRNIRLSKAGDSRSSNGWQVVWGQLSWNSANPYLAGRYSPLFKTDTPLPVTVLDVNGVTIVYGAPRLHAVCFWRIQAPEMKTTAGIMELRTGDDLANPTPPNIVTNQQEWDMT